MPNIKYIARVLTGVRWKKLSHMLNVVHDKCGQSRVHTFFDILWCAARYGAGYYDYVMYGFYDLNGKQRDTYLTRVRNRKVFELMNDPAYNDDFDDKLRFNETFRAYLHRETLNGETATEQQMADFVAGQEYIFAKINHGDSGRGVERLRVADFESPAAMLAYVREKKMVVLEHQLIQHPDMARLHPGSVNTMRILTDNVNGHVTIAYIIVKMGTGDSVCDNSGQGGILARVDVDTGRITTPATDATSTSTTGTPTPASHWWVISCPWCRRPSHWPRRQRRCSPGWGMWAGTWPSRRTAPPSLRATTSPAPICASWLPCGRRRPASGPITRKSLI